MAQKIDSQEFEVANPARYPDATEIVVRVWAPGRSDSDRGTSLSWRSDSVLIYMIADLVGASHGRIAEGSSALMSAQFDSSQQAILAAKRIQTSVFEFLSCRPGERVAAAILIYPASDPAAFSTEAIQQALRQAKPGQILLAGDISKRLRDVPGIELSTVAKLTTIMGERGTELMELVWTTPDRVVLLQNSIADEVESASDDVPLVGATVIVSPFGRGEQTNAAEPPAVGSGGIPENSSATASPQVSPDSNRAQQRPPVLEDLRESPGSFGDGFNELAQRPFLTGTRIILGVVAIVLVAALIAFLSRPTQVSKPLIPLQQNQTGAAETAADKQLPARIEPAKTEPEAVTPPTESTAKTEIAKPQNVKPSNPKSKGKAAVAPQMSAQISDKPPAENRVKLQETPALFADESGGVSQKEIPTLLKMAQADAGAGNYDKARIEFRKILGLQPGNQDAKEGLHKLDLIQK